MSEYKIIEHMSFDWMVVVYFFLGGISAGTFFLSVAANYWKKEFRPLASIAAIITPACLALGMFFLLIDLGKPFRAWRLFLHFNPTSALSWGVWFLNIFFLLSLVYAWFLSKNKHEQAKKFAYLGLPFALLVSTYTGMLLAQAPSRALWHSALIPVLFLVGGLISGIALVMLVSAGKVETEIIAKAGKFLAWLLLLELCLILAEVLVLLNGGTEAIAVVKRLLSGDYSFLFWVVEISLGAVIPIFILFRNRVSPALQAATSMLILIGIFTMRYIVVVGGQIPSY